ncbi:hypothetical protein [Planctobacterium marinum]|uniref:VCBS repeat-containing protein n=1 Tax=Planctobacterium marinum TaxID=1631968 RepID=A0AA48HM01_9ALTE|nr:hypothetical protein MACH26_04530 [Planctobacterium marinum]
MKMQVQSAQIQFAHHHEKQASYTRHESLLAQRKSAEGEAGTSRTLLMSSATAIQQHEQTLSASRNSTGDSGSAEISRRGRALAAQLEQPSQTPQGLQRFLTESEDSDELENTLDAKTWQLKSIVESFTGREIHLSHLQKDKSENQANETKATSSEQTDPPANASANATTTAELIYQYRESYQEQESSLFVASGQITLESGETIQLDLAQYNERNFYIENSLEMRLGEVELTDPLVLNLKGAGAELSAQTYKFDLNQDGEAEQLYFATGNSGFLALDRNNNGIIDDGSELFGAKTGNGFVELAQYDEDQNGFIDAGDSVFSQLLYYQKDASGLDQLSRIQDIGIGAMYLGSEQTPFDIRDNDNQLKAKVRSSGFFLNENGTAGSLQQIDLAV